MEEFIPNAVVTEVGQTKPAGTAAEPTGATPIASPAPAGAGAAKVKPEHDGLEPKKILLYILLGILGFVVLGLVIFGVIKLVGAISGSGSSGPSTSGGGSSVVSDRGDTPEKLDLQLPLDQWLDAREVRDDEGVLIYDIDNSAIVARFNETKTFDMAQLYQLFVAYEGYYRIARGDWADNSIVPGTTEERDNCLDYTLRWSNIICSDALWDEMGRDNLQAAFEARNFNATQLNAFTSTPSDILTLMQLYYNHPGFSDKIFEKIRDTMLNQSGAQSLDGINLRQGLPAGFANATVYNKTGYYREIKTVEEVTVHEDITEEQERQKPVLDNRGRQKKDRRGKPMFETYYETVVVGEKTYLMYNTSHNEDGTMNLWHTYNDTAFVEFPEAKDRDTGEKVPARHYIMVVMTHDTAPQAVVELGRNIESFIKTADNY